MSLIEIHGRLLLWAGFFIFVVGALAVDLGAFQTKTGELTSREVVARLAGWVGLAAVFALGLDHFLSRRAALEFTAGYLLEYALSVDNIFVIIVIFRTFKLPHAHEHRVLFWGIIGAALMRASLILAGTALVQRFAWLNIVFGVFLFFTGVKIFFDKHEDVHTSDAPPEDGLIVRWLKRLLRTTKELRGKHFFVRENGILLATPLFLVLVVVELTDVIFALDSIPAVFGVTTDPFIVLTSNIFAVLGLRTLFFLLQRLVSAFRFLPYGVAVVLAGIGAKMCASHWVEIPVGYSLLAILGILATSIVASLAVKKKVLA